jgi:hypothetical protein
MESESALRAVGERAREIADGAARCQTIAHAAHEAGGAVLSCVDAAAALFKTQEQGDPTQLQAALGMVRVAIEKLQPEAMITTALRSSGALGARRYAAGQPLTVCTAGGWRDADVATAGANGLYHQLTFLEGSGEPPATLTLHPWNHAPRELPHAAFEALRGWWTRELRKQHTQIFDVLTGKRLDALQQCVAIEVMGDADLVGVRDVRGLSDWLHSLHAARSLGEAITDLGAAALLTAPPAAGKTTLISQAVVLTLDRAELVPIVIKVQLLQARLRDAPDAFASHWNWVDAYLCLTERERPEVYRMLRQAMMARRALLLLDGLDEAGAKRAEIEQHIVEVLAPQGHVMLCTSRPAGVVEARFAGFRLLKLAPLTEAQQEQALLQRLGTEGDVRQLMAFVERMPSSTDPDAPTTQHRVTANPLMLSMVASVFEIRKGLGMPETVAELYASASDAMLARGGVVTAEVRTLLEAVFFEAHVAQARVITDVQLLRAALGAFALRYFARPAGRLQRARPQAVPTPSTVGGGYLQQTHLATQARKVGRMIARRLRSNETSSESGGNKRSPSEVQRAFAERMKGSRKDLLSGAGVKNAAAPRFFKSNARPAMLRKGLSFRGKRPDDDALDELADREGEKMGAGRNRTKGNGIAWGPLRNTKQKIVARKLAQKIGAASPPPPAILRQPGFDKTGRPWKAGSSKMLLKTSSGRSLLDLLNKDEWEAARNDTDMQEQLAGKTAEERKKTLVERAEKLYKLAMEAALEQTAALTFSELLELERSERPLQIVIEGFAGVLLPAPRRTLLQRWGLRSVPMTVMLKMVHEDAPVKVELLTASTKSPLAKPFRLKTVVDAADTARKVGMLAAEREAASVLSQLHKPSAIAVESILESRMAPRRPLMRELAPLSDGYAKGEARKEKRAENLAELNEKLKEKMQSRVEQSMARQEQVLDTRQRIQRSAKVMFAPARPPAPGTVGSGRMDRTAASDAASATPATPPASRAAFLQRLKRTPSGLHLNAAKAILPMLPLSTSDDSPASSRATSLRAEDPRLPRSGGGDGGGAAGPTPSCSAFGAGSLTYAPRLQRMVLPALEDAVKKLRDEERAAVAEVRERVGQDRLPLLSLLQVEPLEMQSSHLSFQEYFAARAICTGKYRLPEGSPPPWQWPAFWANAVTLGSEMGDAFGKGLKQTARLSDELDLSKKLIGGDRPTMVAVVAQLMRGLASLSLRENKLTDGEGLKMFAALQTNTTLTHLDLSGNELGAESGKAMGEALKTNTALTQLSLKNNKLGDAGCCALAVALQTNTTLKQLGMGSNSLGADGSNALVAVWKVNRMLTQLDLG